MIGRGPLFGRRRSLRWHQRTGQEPTSVAAAAKVISVDVGGNLRRLREEHHLTIRTLAEASGLAVNTLSLIENGRSSPSVSTLGSLAKAMQVPIAAFFDNPLLNRNIAHVKSAQRPQATIDQGLLEDLGAGASIRSVEPFILTLDGFAGSEPHGVVHTGYEFAYCLEGTVAYTIKTRQYLLETGDSILFEAFLPHCWQNLTINPARMILILIATNERDLPVDIHFLNEKTSQGAKNEDSSNYR